MIQKRSAVLCVVVIVTVWFSPCVLTLDLANATPPSPECTCRGAATEDDCVRVQLLVRVVLALALASHQLRLWLSVVIRCDLCLFVFGSAFGISVRMMGATSGNCVLNKK